MQKFPNYQQVASCDNADSINIRSFGHVASMFAESLVRQLIESSDVLDRDSVFRRPAAARQFVLDLRDDPCSISGQRDLWPPLVPVGQGPQPDRILEERVNEDSSCIVLFRGVPASDGSIGHRTDTLQFHQTCHVYRNEPL